MKRVDVFYTKSDHLVRIMTGLHMLEEQKILKCQYIEDRDHRILPTSANMLEMQIDGMRIAFDLRDASALQQEKNYQYLDSVDAYFERSHTDWRSHPKLQNSAHKIHPFGFNYYTTYPGNPAFYAAGFRRGMKGIVQDLINNSACTRAASFEGMASCCSDRSPTILFMARLWDPKDVKIRSDMTEQEKAYRKHMMEEREKINSDRIEICRKLRKTYGASFCGGIQRTSCAKKKCPDLILPTYLTLKMNYLRVMKKSDICIGSAGLEKSIGWKTGEYVAAARAIVCEEPAYILPGDFREGVHYISYNDPASCLEAVEQLYHSPERIYEMQCANEQYYREYLRPDRQIMNALEICGVF